jgi:hypothetical protein
MEQAKWKWPEARKQQYEQIMIALIIHGPKKELNTKCNQAYTDHFNFVSSSESS